MIIALAGGCWCWALRDRKSPPISPITTLPLQNLLQVSPTSLTIVIHDLRHFSVNYSDKMEIGQIVSPSTCWVVTLSVPRSSYFWTQVSSIHLVFRNAFRQIFQRILKKFWRCVRVTRDKRIPEYKFLWLAATGVSTGLSGLRKLS